MTSPLQRRELRDAMARRAAAREKLAQVVAIHMRATESVNAAAGALTEARAANRTAAGARALGGSSDNTLLDARRSFRAASDAHEIVLEEREGIFELIAPLESDLKNHEEHVHRAAVRICVSEAADIEHHALDLAQQLGDLLGRRRALAVFCMRDGADPLGALDPSSGFRREMLRRLGEPVVGEHPRE